MFIGTIWTFTYKHRIWDVNRPIAVVATLLFLLSTAHMVVCIIHVEDGLVKYRDSFPGGSAAFFADISQATFVANNAIYILQTLLGDGVVIYRCYVVWQSIWVIILPCMMWCGVAVFGVCSVYDFSQASTTSSDVENLFTDETGRWIVTFVALTLTTNVLSTGLLAYRIWMIEQKMLLFILCGALLLNNMFLPLERRTVCYGRLDHPDNLNCLLHGVYSYRDQSRSRFN